MKSALRRLVYTEVVLHIFLWRGSLASFEAAAWGALMQILYYRLVSDFPKIEYRSRLFSCISVGAVVHEFLWLLHLFQEHGPSKRRNESCLCFHAGPPEDPVSFCVHNIALILLSVWAMPLSLLFCWLEDRPKVVINFVGLDAVSGDGNATDAYESEQTSKYLTSGG